MNNKKAQTEKEAFEIQEKYNEQPYGWIQWKATDVFMYIHCKCGHHSSVDGTFAYYIQCDACGTVYAVNGHVELVEILDAKNLKVILTQSE